MHPVSKRAESISPFLAMEVMERGMTLVRSGVDVVQMGVGQPDFDAPAVAIEAAIAGLRSGRTHYTDSRGLHPLRVAIAEDSRKRRGVAVDPDRIVVTMGTSPAIRMVLGTLLDPGDEIIVPTPHYPCYPTMIEDAGGVPVYVETHAADGFLLDPESVARAITKRTRGILLGSPANPTGTVQPRDVVEAIAALGLPILSDEIYDGLLYDGAKTTSPLGLTDDVYVLDGVSKRYAMTGFRIGWVIAPERAVRPLVSMQQNFFISAPEPSQLAAQAAIESGAADAERMRAIYESRRRLLVDGIRALGLPLPVAPTGAFYVLADARAFGEKSLDLAFEILERAHVALGPGRDFGPVAEGFLRFSFAVSEERIREGLARLGAVLPTLRS